MATKLTKGMHHFRLPNGDGIIVYAHENSTNVSVHSRGGLAVKSEEHTLNSGVKTYEVENNTSSVTLFVE